MPSYGFESAIIVAQCNGRNRRNGPSTALRRRETRTSLAGIERPTAIWSRRSRRITAPRALSSAFWQRTERGIKLFVLPFFFAVSLLAILFGSHLAFSVEDSFGMLYPTSKNIAEKPDAEKPDQALEASSRGDHCVMPHVQAKRFWASFIDAASASGDDANVRMILPSFVHIDDRTRVQLSEPSRRL